MTKTGSSKKRAFSLVEITVVIAILALIIGIAVPALFTSREDTIKLSENATAKTLNDAVTRATVKQDTGIEPLLLSGDQDAIIQYLVENDYIKMN